MCDTSDLSGLVAGSALVDSFVFGEGASNGERVDAPLRLHQEVLGRFDDGVVVVPLYHGLCVKEEYDRKLACCLLLFCALAISKVISGQVLTCNHVHSW